MKIKITSDSTCDLSRELIKKYNIGVIPLTVVKEGEEFKDGVNITPNEIFSHVDNGGNLCSTSAINSEDYSEFFERNIENQDAVIHICLGSDFSSCYQNACIASEKYNKVYVVDSKNLSTGHGHVVIKAAELASSGSNPDEIVNELNIFVTKVEASFILDRLDYMVKGGRCSSVAALGANILKLHPCIEVKDGKMKMVKKYRGGFDKCLNDYIKDRLYERENIEKDKIFITHTPVTEDSMNIATSCVSNYGSFKNVMETEAGCTVSCHCGPRTLGVLFIRK